MHNTRDAVRQILSELYPGLDAEKEADLIRSGVLDSFGMVSLIAQIRAVLDVKVPPEKILPENFRSLAAICELLELLRNP